MSVPTFSWTVTRTHKVAEYNWKDGTVYSRITTSTTYEMPSQTDVSPAVSGAIDTATGAYDKIVDSGFNKPRGKPWGVSYYTQESRTAWT